MKGLTDMKRLIAFALILAMLFATACSKSAIDASFGEKRTQFNDSLSLTDTPLTGGDIPSDFSDFYEAEDGVLSGSATVSAGSEYSGGYCVKGVNSKQNGDMLTFKVNIENEGMYDLSFGYYTQDINKINEVSVDGKSVGYLYCYKANELDFSDIRNVYLSEGQHDISIIPSWGWVNYDSLTVTKSTVITDETYNVTASLSNPNADENTQRLYKFLCDIYGKYSLTGQFADKGRESNEYKAIEFATGKNFAVLGLDMMNYSLVNRENGATCQTVEVAHDWYHNAGGIVQICWHWNTSTEYKKDGSNWWNTFYAENTTIDLDKIMNGEDAIGYDYLMADIDNIASELKRLCDDGVPVLWRPLHEASGGWFWWGDCSPESYIGLWQTMYDKLTNEHGLTNLIWMWNGQSADWYPGDEYVDIVSWDIYADEHDYSSYSGTFAEAASCYGETKLIALSENGVVMDPEQMFKANARWLFWGTWVGDFVIDDGPYISQRYTEKSMLIKAYESEYTLTLDELPNLKKYPLE